MPINAEKIVVLSDLHLWGPQDPLYRALLRFIDAKLQPGDKFFIVGDLFDLFIGNKKIFSERFHELIEAIRKLGTRNIEVFYIEGNHDFHLEGIFDDSPHVRMYSDYLHYEWNGKKFLFSHGDKINWRDFSYQAFRIVTRNLLFQCIVEAVPGEIIDKIGNGMSKASRGYHSEPTEKVVQLFRNYACDQISGGYDFVIMGHSHHIDDMHFRVGDHSGQYVNVGYPRKHRKYLELHPGQKTFELKLWDDLIPLRPVQTQSG